jgi:ABC-2 type transport system permease protein
VVYLVSGFRWSFNEVADVNVYYSLGATVLFLALSLLVVNWIFKSGYRLKS